MIVKDLWKKCTHFVFDKSFNMVHSAAIDCTNSSSKQNDDRLSFFKLPRDPNLKKIWISKLKLKHLPKEENVFVCHHHLEDSCFQRDLRVRILSEFFIFTCLCQIVILKEFFIHFLYRRNWSVYPRGDS